MATNRKAPDAPAPTPEEAAARKVERDEARLRRQRGVMLKAVEASVANARVALAQGDIGAHSEWLSIAQGQLAAYSRAVNLTSASRFDSDQPEG